MGDRTAFFYGTLMAPAVLFRVCHGNSNPTQVLVDHIKIRPAILHGHQRRRVRLADYPGMIPSGSSNSVRGTVVTGLTDGDIWRLDIFEGDEYDRQKVNVKVLETEGDTHTGEGNVEGEEVEAETYIWIAGEHALEDREWDFAEFQKEKMRFWVGAEGAGEYADVDKAVATQDHDPTRGRGLNGSITKALEEDRKKEKDVLGSAV